MLCQLCNSSEAVVRFTDMVDGEKRQLSLCNACVQAKGVVVEPHVLTGSQAPIPVEAVEKIIGPVIEAIKGATQKAAQGSREPERSCPKCGITFAEFKKRGRLGCSHDYEAFEEEMTALLEKIHGRSVHKGRAPERVRKQRVVRHRVDVLRRELDQAVQQENYELAARLRDRLRELEKPGGDSDA